MALDRFVRQISVPEIGQKGQDALAKAHIVVVGAGGLGCPVLLYLASCGVGKITIIDNDNVSLSNLHRQILFTQKDIGSPKAGVAADYLTQIYPDGVFIPIVKRLDTPLAHTFIPDCDLVIDGTDSFLSKYILSDICRLYNKKLLIGSVVGLSGYVAGFGEGCYYEDVFPTPPLASPNCNEAGVLGSVAGFLGVSLATEALKIIMSVGQTLVGRLLRYSALQSDIREMVFISDKTQEKPSLSDVIFVETYDKKDYDIIDIRDLNEYADLPPLEGTYSLPMKDILDNPFCIKDFQKPILICKTGMRAERTALTLALLGIVPKIYILCGGLQKS